MYVIFSTFSIDIQSLRKRQLTLQYLLTFAVNGGLTLQRRTINTVAKHMQICAAAAEVQNASQEYDDFLREVFLQACSNRGKPAQSSEHFFHDVCSSFFVYERKSTFLPTVYFQLEMFEDFFEAMRQVLNATSNDLTDAHEQSTFYTSHYRLLQAVCNAVADCLIEKQCTAIDRDVACFLCEEEVFATLLQLQDILVDVIAVPTGGGGERRGGGQQLMRVLLEYTDTLFRVVSAVTGEDIAAKKSLLLQPFST